MIVCAARIIRIPSARSFHIRADILLQSLIIIIGRRSQKVSVTVK